MLAPDDEQRLDEGGRGRDRPRSGRAFFGAMALAGSNLGRIGLQMLVLPVLARLLGPEAFGIVSLAMPFILFANMLSDAGMGAALVRQRNPSHEVESTVFWISAAIGVALAALVWAGAAPVAALLRQPRVTPVLIALSPVLILSSSLSVANARISRARHFALFAAGDCLSVLLSSAAAIAAALAGWGEWSLVIQQVVLWAVKAAWVLPAARFRPAFVFRPALVRSLWSFGLNNVGANIADFMGKSVPALVIGAQIGVVAVGKYAMAYQVVRAPDMILSGPLFLTTFTAVAALSGSQATAAPLAMRSLRMIAAVLAPLYCGLALVADLLISLFLGPRWHGAAPALAALAPGAFFLCLYSVSGAVLMGLGRADLQFRLSLFGGVAILLGVGVGARFGLAEAAAGVSLGAACVLPLYVGALAAQLRTPWRRMVASLSWPLMATAAMALAVVVARRELVLADPWMELAVSVLIGAAVFLAVLALTFGRQLVEDLRHILPRRPEIGAEPI